MELINFNGKNDTILEEEEYEYTVEFNVFGYWVYIIYTNNIQKSREKRQDVIGAVDEILASNVDGLHSYNELRHDSYVFFTPKSSIGTIVHECFHALWRMFKLHDVKMDNENYAYHLGYLTEKVLNFKYKVDFINEK